MGTRLTKKAKGTFESIKKKTNKVGNIGLPESFPKSLNMLIIGLLKRLLAVHIERAQTVG